jgi:hypothetical protein
MAMPNQRVQRAQSVWELRDASASLADRIGAEFETVNDGTRGSKVRAYELQRALNFQRRVTDVLNLLIRMQQR